MAPAALGPPRGHSPRVGLGAALPAADRRQSPNSLGEGAAHLTVGGVFAFHRPGSCLSLVGFPAVLPFWVPVHVCPILFSGKDTSINANFL